jgi:TRAP-type C4-dicarboxylate transport system substrate-binding protein
MKKIISLVVGTLLLTAMTVTGANSAQTLKSQTVISAKADEVKMLKDFTDTVTELTQGSLKFDIKPAGAVVGVKETLDPVDKGLIDSRYAWTH